MNKTLVVIGVIVLLVAVGLFFRTGSVPGVVTPSGTVLNLSNQGLTSVSMSVFDRTNLQELDISNNRIAGGLPSQIQKLKRLRVLDASNNAMTGVPAEIGQLTALETLNLSNNQLTGLPNELGNLTHLKTLNLSGNTVSQSDLAGIRAKLPATVNIITD
jgi:Leucine-rich repeat (LRR) protein